jgi:hypothetical protein
MEKQNSSRTLSTGEVSQRSFYLLVSASEPKQSKPLLPDDLTFDIQLLDFETIVNGSGTTGLIPLSINSIVAKRMFTKEKDLVDLRVDQMATFLFRENSPKISLGVPFNITVRSSFLVCSLFTLR